MNINRLRTYAAWTSLGAVIFLVALALTNRLLLRGFLSHPVGDILLAAGLAVLIIACILGLPRWPAVVALIFIGLLFLYSLPDSCTPVQERIRRGQS
jgi:hypothetical protein